MGQRTDTAGRRTSQATTGPELSSQLTQFYSAFAYGNRSCDCSEKALLGVTAVDANGVIIGHAAFYDDPGVPGVLACDWETWLAAHFAMQADILPSSCLFLRLLVTAPAYEGKALSLTRELLR